MPVQYEFAYAKNLYTLETAELHIGDIILTCCSGVHTYVKVTKLIDDFTFWFIQCNRDGIPIEAQEKVWDTRSWPVGYCIDDFGCNTIIGNMEL